MDSSDPFRMILILQMGTGPEWAADLPGVSQLVSESPTTHFSCLMAFHSPSQLLTFHLTLA